MAITIPISVAGSYTIEDDGIPGNGTSVVRRDSDGSIFISFIHPADSLTILATVPGVHLTINFTDSLGNCPLTVGDLANSSLNPDSIVVKSIRSFSNVTLVSNGAITEGGSDASADISAGSLILSAFSGVGTPGNALETQTDELEAETVTGGINIGNVGDLRVGGFSAAVDGLDVVTSGDIKLTNLGSITLSDETSFDSVHGGDVSGNVTLIANGFDSDITSDINQSSITASRGDILLTAGRDVSFGLGGTEFGNDVRANGSIIVNAGRDFLLSGFADFFADGILGTTGGDLIVNAGRNISLLDDTGNSASLAVLGTGGGDIILNTGPNGKLTLEPPSTNTISTGSGDVTISADRVAIGATSGITAGGDVILKPVSDGRIISLGSLSDGAAALELSDGELDRIFADSLTLGSPETGAITIGAPITPANVTDFLLHSGADIEANLSLIVAGALSLLAGDNITLLGGATLQANTVTAFVDQAGDDGGAGAFGSFAGTITATSATLTGAGENDVITATAGTQTLVGLGGNDTLDGGAGADTMIGGLGNDTYFVDTASDVVTELSGQGTDTVRTALSYTLGANLENLVLLGGASVNGTGNNLNNNITGNSGNNIIDGGVGADGMSGGAGDDTYFVDNLADGITENAASGTDTVRTTVSHTLAGNIENLVLLGGSSINGTGNALANQLTGNSGNNILNGAGGADAMTGGFGDDTYVVDNAGDTVFETASTAGTDLVQSSVNYTLGANQENLTLTGAAAINGTGNSLANIINGNGGANILNGAGGADTMAGGGGGDTYVVDNAGDLVTEGAGAGTDLVQSNITYALTANVENLTLTGATAINGTGNGLDNVITGNNGVNTLDGGGGSDTLNGGAGADTMIGGANNDTYVVENAGDVVTESAGGGTDTVQSSISYTLAAEVETLVLTGTAAINGTGNALANQLTGNSGANILNGGAGNDDLSGLGGADQFRFDTALNAATNVDDILDFSVPDDVIALNRTIFTGIGANGTLAASAFVLGTSAGDADDRIIYNQATGQIFYDADGTGGASAAILFATVTPGTALTNADFIGYI